MPVGIIGPKKLILDGEDISSKVCAIDIEMQPGELPLLKLHVRALTVLMDDKGHIHVETPRFDRPTQDQ